LPAAGYAPGNGAWKEPAALRRLVHNKRDIFRQPCPMAAERRFTGWLTTLDMALIPGCDR